MKKHEEDNQLVEKMRSELAQCKENYLRVLADYQNLDKRTKNEINEVRQFAGEVVIGKFLSIFDTIKRANDHLKDEGLALAFKQIESTLTQLGVEQIACVGKSFNPHEMECIEAVEGEEDKVVEEVLAGYTLYGKVLRVAQVKVGKRLL